MQDNYNLHSFQTYTFVSCRHHIDKMMFALYPLSPIKSAGGLVLRRLNFCFWKKWIKKCSQVSQFFNTNVLKKVILATIIVIWKFGRGCLFSPGRGRLCSPGRGRLCSPDQGCLCSPGRGRLCSPGRGRHCSPSRGCLCSPDQGCLCSPGLGCLCSPGRGCLCPPGRWRLCSPGPWVTVQYAVLLQKRAIRELRNKDRKTV